mmetsp:Transcript_104594/g.213319  ORF Transcript_104594/g.213319 Transcript_104594/m.213319 type:complete len:84 (-) Transcript_104594:914-1165(-)
MLRDRRKMHRDTSSAKPTHPSKAAPGRHHGTAAVATTGGAAAFSAYGVVGGACTCGTRDAKDAAAKEPFAEPDCFSAAARKSS